jgi:hypothetical protein
MAGHHIPRIQTNAVFLSFIMFGIIVVISTDAPMPSPGLRCRVLRIVQWLPSPTFLFHHPNSHTARLAICWKTHAIHSNWRSKRFAFSRRLRHAGGFRQEWSGSLPLWKLHALLNSLSAVLLMSDCFVIP